MKSISALAAALIAASLLAGCSAPRAPYHAPHGYAAIPQPTGAAEYAARVAEAGKQAFVSQPHGLKCRVLATYAADGSLTSAMAQGGDPQLCERAIELLKNGAYNNFPEPPAELRGMPIAMEFQS
ncbi:cell envelope integrity TolA C-terminal domain-containing protein [Escherichia coli]